MAKKIVMRTGEALVEADEAWSAAEPEVVIGELDGPVGYAIANLIGDQVKGHSRVWAILNSDVQVRPQEPVSSPAVVPAWRHRRRPACPAPAPTASARPCRRRDARGSSSAAA